MDIFDFDEIKEEPPPKKERPGMVWNILTILALMASLGVTAAFISIFRDPQSSFNPFPPPENILPTRGPTFTATNRPFLPATWTPTAPLPATYTPTPRQTSTPLFTEASYEFPTETPGPELTPGSKSFVLDQGSPKALPNIYHQEMGCNWSGVGGMVVDMRGGPVQGILVELGGTLSGKSVQMLTITTPNSLASRLDFEFEIADKPVVSNKTLWLQLLDQAGLPLSEKVYFETYDDCEKNLIVVYFKQVR
jgi:hypothetical protein